MPRGGVRTRSGGPARASRATLQGAALVFAEPTPNARVLAGLEGVLQADLGDGAAGAHSLRLLDLVDGGTSVADREEEFRVGREAGGFVAPIHGDAPCVYFDRRHARLREPYPAVLQGEWPNLGK